MNLYKMELNNQAWLMQARPRQLLARGAIDGPTLVVNSRQGPSCCASVPGRSLTIRLTVPGSGRRPSRLRRNVLAPRHAWGGRGKGGRRNEGSWSQNVTLGAILNSTNQSHRSASGSRRERSRVTKCHARGDLEFDESKPPIAEPAPGADGPRSRNVTLWADLRFDESKPPIAATLYSSIV